MNSTEIAFFAVALLLPLVGGGALLYFLSRGATKGSTDSKDTGDDKREE